MTDSAPEVSVVVATHNRAEILRENIESVLAQDCNSFEAVYVEDDSTDNTAEVLGSYGQRIRVVRGAWHAPGPARNAGVREARGRLLLFTDDDCTVPRDWIARMKRARETYGCDALSGGFAPHSLETKASRYLHYRMRLLFGHKPKPVRATPMMNFLLPKALFERAGGFSDEPWEALEDWEFCHRLRKAGASLFYDPTVRVTHRYQTDWEPAMRRLRATAAGAVEVYAASGMSVSQLMVRSTFRCLTSPVWSAIRYPLELYGTSLSVEWCMYWERLRAWMGRFGGNRSEGSR